MAGITLAWLIGESIIIWRSVGRNHRPPMPGELAGSSLFFALCAVIAEYPPARTAATLLAFGIDIAAWLEVPAVAGPPSAKAPQRKPASPAVTGPRTRGTATAPTPTGA